MIESKVKKKGLEDHQESHRSKRRSERKSEGYASRRDIPDPHKNSQRKTLSKKKMLEEPEFKSEQSLNERALLMVTTEDYLLKVKEIKAGNPNMKSMEFIMDGVKIELPFLGGKVT